MALLEIHELRKTYPTGEKALKGVSLSVNSQDLIAILGLSGSGKSTFLRCINRLVEPDSGSVILDGINVTELDSRALRQMRRNIGMIFQEFNLVDRLTVLENVLSGCLGYTALWRCVLRAFAREDIERAIETCERVGLIEHIRKRADELSGGQRQRVGIARALMQKPRILLLDEPTSSLDPKIGGEIMDLMTKLAEEDHVPMLISLHDLGLARKYSRRIVAMQAGVKVLDAKTSSVERDTLHDVYNIVAA